MRKLLFCILPLFVFLHCDDSTGSETIAICNNDTIEEGEICDGTDLNNASCTSINRGFTGGTLSCQSSCVLDTSSCTAEHTDCGDGEINGSEICDGTDLGNETCGSVNSVYTGGTLSCNNCTFDVSACTLPEISTNNSNNSIDDVIKRFCQKMVECTAGYPQCVEGQNRMFEDFYSLCKTEFENSRECWINCNGTCNEPIFEYECNECNVEDDTLAICYSENKNY